MFASIGGLTCSRCSVLLPSPLRMYLFATCCAGPAGPACKDAALHSALCCHVAFSFGRRRAFAALSRSSSCCSRGLSASWRAGGGGPPRPPQETRNRSVIRSRPIRCFTRIRWQGTSHRFRAWFSVHLESNVRCFASERHTRSSVAAQQLPANDTDTCAARSVYLLSSSGRMVTRPRDAGRR